MSKRQMSNLLKGYREMANDVEREREAAVWIEGIAGDIGKKNTSGRLDSVEELNREPFPSRRPPVTPRRKIF